MSTQTIELEGFEIELASELYCDRGGDHRELGTALVRIAEDWATTSTNRRCCAYGA